MDPLEDLLEALQAHPLVKTFKRLEERLFNDAERQRAFDDLRVLQKKMVRSEAAHSPSRARDRENYEAALATLSEDPLIVQYLSYQEDVNALLSEIVSTLEAGLSAPLEDLFERGDDDTR